MPATTFVWIGTTDTAFATAGNWSPSGPPTTGDTVIVDGRATKALAGSDQSAITLASLQTFEPQYAIGSAGTRLKIGATSVEIGLTPSDGSSGTPAEVHLDLHTAATTVVVGKTANTGTSGIEPVTIKGVHTSNSFTVSGPAVVGIATAAPADVATFPTINIQNQSAKVRVGSGVTTTTVTKTTGDLVLRCAATTLTTLAGTTKTEGAGAITTANIADKATLNSSGTIASLYVESGGTAILDDSKAARTVTSTFVSGSGKVQSGLHVTHTNGVDCLRGAKSSQVDFGTNVTVTPTAL